MTSITAPKAPVALSEFLENIPTAFLSEEQFDILMSVTLDSLVNEATERAYRRALKGFRDFVFSECEGEINGAIVEMYRAHLSKRLSPATVNKRLAAVRKFGYTGGRYGLLDVRVASHITTTKGVASRGRKMGDWLTEGEVQILVGAPDGTTVQGARDRAILAICMGCGLRRSEVTALKWEDIERRGGRWVITVVRGKHGKTRTVPLPAKVKQMIDEWGGWLEAHQGYVFRSVDRWENIGEGKMADDAIRLIVNKYRDVIGHPKLAPHDLRRTFAQALRRRGVPIDQIQVLLGHSSVNVTQRYLNTALDLSANDFFDEFL